MSTSTDTIDKVVKSEYKYGFYSDIETESAPPGLNEGIIRFISDKKKEPEWLLEWRLKAYRHWTTLQEPTWQKADYPKIDYQDIIYFAAPKSLADGPKSMDEVEASLLKAGLVQLTSVVADAPTDRSCDAHHQE